MSLNLEEVKRISHLARLKFSENDLAIMQQQLNGILHWIDHLQSVDTTKTEIFSDLQIKEMPERDDVICDGDIIESILGNAPESAHNMFAVPKVVE